MGTNYAPQNGMVLVNEANTSLDGSGAMGEVIIGDSPYGTAIKSVTIKALQDTSEGMIRLFLEKDGKRQLFKEFPVPLSQGDDSISIAYNQTYTFNEFHLAPGVKLLVSTEKQEAFSIIVMAFKIISYSNAFDQINL